MIAYTETILAPNGLCVYKSEKRLLNSSVGATVLFSPFWFNFLRCVSWAHLQAHDKKAGGGGEGWARGEQLSKDRRTAGRTDRMPFGHICSWLACDTKIQEKSHLFHTSS